MPPIIAKPNITKKTVKFQLSALSNKTQHFYTVVDRATGRQVAWGPVGDALAATSASLDIAPDLVGLDPGNYEIRVYTDAGFHQSQGAPKRGESPEEAREFQLVSAQLGGQAPPAPESRLVRLERSATEDTEDQVLWSLIEGWTTSRQFRSYSAWIDHTVCRSPAVNAFPSTSYDELVNQTRQFLERSVTLVDQQGALKAYLYEGDLPYVADILERYPEVDGEPCAELTPNLLEPFPVELIWSYWHEEGALVQTLNHILARFQNRRASRGADPLARFDLSPLRPLRHILWQWAEDEDNRLTVRRRAAEYEYEYGLALVGRAVPGSQLWAERRTKFLEAFHTLLHVAHLFFQQDDDTTVQADAFPVLNALRETHLVLSEGAHNQYGDLPTEARIQMLIMQWLLAQPEMRDFLGGKPMVPYEEPWMDRVDTMKAIQGWTDTSVTHFHDLAVFGEQLLLSIRLGNWNSVIAPDAAKNWARKWRAQIQRYAHAYRAATGVDLTAGVDARMPAVLLARRTATQRQRA